MVSYRQAKRTVAAISQAGQRRAEAWQRGSAVERNKKLGKTIHRPRSQRGVEGFSAAGRDSFRVNLARGVKPPAAGRPADM